MNAHTQIGLSPVSRAALDQVQGNLHRISQLAIAASVVIEHQLGQDAPAEILDAILSTIEDLANDSGRACSAALPPLPPE